MERESRLGGFPTASIELPEIGVWGAALAAE